MSDRFPGGVISKTPPTVVAPVDGEGGSASGVWTLDEVLGYEKAGAWPKGILPRELYAWGFNSAGQLGDNSTASRSSPVQIGALTTWAQVSTKGFGHTVALKTDGTLWTWGAGTNGGLGSGNVISRSSPVQVGALTNWKYVSAGGYGTTAAVKTDGTLWAWGFNVSGQLGLGDTVSRSSPVQVGSLTNWSRVSVGSFSHMVAVKSDGTLWAWGYASSGQLGDGTKVSKSSPVQIGSLTNWKSVAAGTSHTVAAKTDNTLWAWGGGGGGYNTSVGQVGDNTTVNKSSPVQIGSLTDWDSVDAGDNSTTAIRLNGTIWCWGINTYGQVGDNSTVGRSSPVQVGVLTNWSGSKMGSGHTLALKSDGSLWAWGNGGVGRLGDTTSINKSSPVQVGVETNWFLISAGGATSAAITKG